MEKRIETNRLIITKFTHDMAQAVHQNSLDEDTRRFLPDEVFETVEDAAETIDFLMSQYEGADGPFVYPIITNDGGKNIGYKYAHDFPNHYVEQEYMPNPKKFLNLTNQGKEKIIKERQELLRKKK